MTSRVGILASRIRVEEKHLIASFEARGATVEIINDDDLIMSAGMQPLPYDVILERSISTSRGLYAVRMLEAAGNVVINRWQTSKNCGAKLLTTASLQKAGVAPAKGQVAVTPRTAPKASERMGYPAVLQHQL